MKKDHFLIINFLSIAPDTLILTITISELAKYIGCVQEPFTSGIEDKEIFYNGTVIREDKVKIVTVVACSESQIGDFN